MQILSLTPDSVNQKWGAGGSNSSLENHPDGSAWEALLWTRRSQFCLLKSPEQASIDPALPHSILIFADGPQAPWFRRSTGDCNEQPSWWATVLDVSPGPQEVSVLFEGKPGGIRTDGSCPHCCWVEVFISRNPPYFYGHGSLEKAPSTRQSHRCLAG